MQPAVTGFMLAIYFSAGIFRGLQKKTMRRKKPYCPDALAVFRYTLDTFYEIEIEF